MKTYLISVFLFLAFPLFSQELRSLEAAKDLRLVFRLVSDEPVARDLPNRTPLLSFEVNGLLYTSTSPAFKNGTLSGKLSLSMTSVDTFRPGYKSILVFTNISKDTLTLRNVVPFGASDKHIYLSGLGDHWLSRSHLFLPGQAPINVILPDNAWELGYAALKVDEELSVYALTRRKKWDHAERKRFETVLAPGGSVTYELYADFYKGEWQEGFRKAFRDRWLYDLPVFDNTMYERKDLQWIRDAYVMHLIMAWDNWFYDANEGCYHLDQFIQQSQKLYGGNDVIGIWPTWPSLGLDQRNQWDLFRDLPGGLGAIQDQATLCRANGSRFFICYNPWDESTRGENHLDGMADLIRETGADGVVLDTKGESSKDLQQAADKVHKGVVMYSEGMAVPKDMPGIVSGRVHNALYYPPMLNLNKLIKPEFAIFRVAELYLEPIRREFNTSFFNGYGTELNVFHSGKPTAWMEEQYRYWGRSARILRENSNAFHSRDWTPLIPTLRDSIYVNYWPMGDKSIYSIYSLIPQGFTGKLFEVSPAQGFHFVDLWGHREIEPETMNGKYYIPVALDAFNASWLGTNNEGAISCIARLPGLLQLELDAQADLLKITSPAGREIRVWAGAPDYEKIHFDYVSDGNYFELRLSDHFDRYEGDFVVQLFDAHNQLQDERIVTIAPGTPRLVSRSTQLPVNATTPADMALVPGGPYTWVTTHGDDFIAYPDQDTGKLYQIPSFFMDKDLVTNANFQYFVDETHYVPTDTSRFLLAWKNGADPKAPVVHVSYEDACAYCAWKNKRLPTEREWQYAAQYGDGRIWPWGMTFDSTRCNPGNGKMDLVGRYPLGANSIGIRDLVGSVWQLTNDVYQNGSYRYILLKGGSYFKPTASWWYVQGGAQPLTHRQQLLRVSQGFERNATVGFRCIRD